MGAGLGVIPFFDQRSFNLIGDGMFQMMSLIVGFSPGEHFRQHPLREHVPSHDGASSLQTMGGKARPRWLVEGYQAIAGHTLQRIGHGWGG